MKKIIFFSLLTLGALILAPMMASAAWTAPLVAPPACTAGSPGCDAPVNVGPVEQEKAGAISFSVPRLYSALKIKNKDTGKVVFSINPYDDKGKGYFNIWGSNDGGTWLSLITGKDGKVGIGGGGAPKIPVETLDVEGAIKIGNTTGRNAGTIRWTGQDFEGYDSTEWISLTAKGDVGNTLSGSCPSGQYINGINNGIPVCSEPATYTTDSEFDFAPMGSTFSLPDLRVGESYSTVSLSTAHPYIAPKKMVRAVVVSLTTYPVHSGGGDVLGWGEIEIRGHKDGIWNTIYKNAWNNGILYIDNIGMQRESKTYIIPISPNTVSGDIQYPGGFQIKNTFTYPASTIKGTGTIIAYIYGNNKLGDHRQTTVTVPIRAYNRGWGGHHMSCGTEYEGASTEMNFVFGRFGGPYIGQVCGDAFVKALAGDGSIAPSGSGTITINQGSRDMSKTVTYTPNNLSSLPITIQSGAMVNGLLNRIERSLDVAKYSCNRIQYSINRSFGWSPGTPEGTSIGNLVVTCTS